MLADRDLADPAVLMGEEERGFVLVEKIDEDRDSRLIEDQVPDRQGYPMLSRKTGVEEAMDREDQTLARQIR